MLDEKTEKALPAFVEEMKSLFGNELVSLNLFGEGAIGDAKNHTKLLAVLSEVGPDQLRKYAGVHGKWLKKGIHPPLMLTLDTMETSTDVFPMEFFEMKESYRLLHGKDVLAGLDISHENLRRQCEEQVKGKFIHLRQSYMEVADDRKGLAQLIAASVGPFTEVMRNVLRLKGDHIHVQKETIIKEFCEKTGLDDAPFMGALSLRRGADLPSREQLERLFSAYLAEAGKMAEKIDKMEL